MATVNNTSGSTTGTATNGTATIRTARTSAAGGMGKATLAAPIPVVRTLTDFDAAPPDTNLDNRFDDPRFYQGDTDA